MAGESPPTHPPTCAGANFTITNQVANWDFIRHLTLIEPFEPTWGKWKWIHFANDVCKYELGCVVCVLAIGGEGQQVVASRCQLNLLINASPEAWLPQGVNGKQKVSKVLSDTAVARQLNCSQLFVGDDIIVSDQDYVTLSGRLERRGTRLDFALNFGHQPPLLHHIPTFFPPP